MEIRHLSDPPDARAVIHTNALAWRKAYHGIVPDEMLDGMETDPSEQRVLQAFEHLYADRDSILLAEDDAGTVRGYSYIRWGDETKAFVGENEAGLKEIYVEPTCWGEGIGTALLEEGLALLPDSVERIRLEMLDGNEIGQQFYAARGFERTGSSTFEIDDEQYPTSIYTLQL